ncbi:hypothetical protein BDN67DRAFT_912998, partial [Paxillus ammoniavirescens]
HQALNKVLAPLKVATTVWVMMSDLLSNLRYCYTPLASWIADTPEESLLVATSPKAFPVTTATSNNFDNPFCHSLHTGSFTLATIHSICTENDALNYKNFLKAIKPLSLNGMVEPFWKDCSLSNPSDFFTPEPLHHFHHMFWDHDAKWCITVVGAAELDFRFSLLQTTLGYHPFKDGISKLKQVTGYDHCAIQCYIISVITSAVSWPFLIVVCALIEFQYRAQPPFFTDNSLIKVVNALQEFHNHKDAILYARAWKDSWGIPKLELLQSVVPSICLSGVVMQWFVDTPLSMHMSKKSKFPLEQETTKTTTARSCNILIIWRNAFDSIFLPTLSPRSKGRAQRMMMKFLSRRMNMNQILTITCSLST